MITLSKRGFLILKFNVYVTGLLLFLVIYFSYLIFDNYLKLNVKDSRDAFVVDFGIQDSKHESGSQS